MPGRCPGTSFFKNNEPCATEGGSILFIFLSKYSIFRSVDNFNILFCGVNELGILFDGVSELSIFVAVNKLNILFHGVNELHITLPVSMN